MFASLHTYIYSSVYVKWDSYVYKNYNKNMADARVFEFQPNGSEFTLSTCRHSGT